MVISIRTNLLALMKNIMMLHKKQTGYTLSEKEHEYIDVRLPQIEKLLTAPESAKMDIEIAENNHGATPFYAEINVEDDGKFFRATSDDVSAESAFEGAKNALLREIRDKKDRADKSRKKWGAKLKNMFRFGGGE